MPNKTHILLEQIERDGVLAKGKAGLMTYLGGGTISLRQSVYAKCYDCMSNFIDGKVDCNVPTCPLYPFMAYRSGGSRKAKRMNEQQKAASAARLSGRERKLLAAHKTGPPGASATSPATAESR